MSLFYIFQIDSLREWMSDCRHLRLVFHLNQESCFHRSLTTAIEVLPPVEVASWSCLWSLLLWMEMSLNGFPKKFCDLSPLLWPPYPLIGRTSFMSSLSLENSLRKPSDTFMKFRSSAILVSKSLGFISIFLNTIVDRAPAPPLFSVFNAYFKSFSSLPIEFFLYLGVVAAVRYAMFLLSTCWLSLIVWSLILLRAWVRVFFL